MDKSTYLRIRSELSFAPSPTKLRNHILQDLMLIALSACLLNGKTVWGYPLSQLLLACLYFRAFSMMHEAVHGNLSLNGRVNDWLGVLYGGICCLPYTTWRTVHLDHHSWAGNVEKDPVMRIVHQFPDKPDLRKKIDTYLWRSWIPYLAFMQEVVFWSASAKLVFGRNGSQGKRIELVASVIAPFLVFVGLMAAGRALGHILLLLPSIITYLVMVEVINFPHHLNLPSVVGNGKLSLWNQYKISRTCVYSPWFSRLVLLNFNYHAEHHMFPNLPWHQLPNAHTKVMAVKPGEYQMCEGHEWIRLNRQKDLKEVFAATKVLNPEEIKKPDAA